LKLTKTILSHRVISVRLGEIMQIDIDFAVFQALTARRKGESDTYNAVLRRVLKLPEQKPLAATAISESASKVDWVVRGSPPRNIVQAWAAGLEWDSVRKVAVSDGAWFDNTFFPNGTCFRATYKGGTFAAEIRDGCWIGGDGTVRTSPSAAAGAISNTNVNGWRFWHAQLPGDPSWRRLDELKQ
jgi:hypothetical protein